ncbi:MAG: flavin reductase [Clostridia bacterium]|nr:flavin reductase [Clostridia bacterium]
MVDESVFMKIPYGLYLLTSKNEYKDNGCIINTVVQVTSNPNRIAVCVNKQNYTLSMILETKKFNVSLLTTDTPFEFVENFGFKTGKAADKMAYLKNTGISENGIIYTKDNVSTVMSANLIEKVDCGTHILLIGEVCEAMNISDKEPLTYSYYQKNIKPKPKAKKSGGKVWVCQICGYEYDEEKEGVAFEDLPSDWVCPLCKHPKSDFELLK